MIKRCMSLIMSLCAFFTFISVSQFAFADDITWRYDNSDNTLYISGVGNMYNYENAYSAPWKDYLLQCRHIVIEEGVLSLGNYAFAGASSLTDVEIADSVTVIGAGTFAACPLLNELNLSENIVSIRDISFYKNGNDNKTDFVINTKPGTFSLYYSIKNSIPFNCNSVESGINIASLKGNTNMLAYFPYTAQLNGTFVFYSVSKYDPIGYVYDDAFNKLAENDDYSTLIEEGMDGCDFGIEINLQAGKTYYFATELINPSITADYNVYIKGKDYYLHGNIYVMSTPQGDLSNIKMTDALFNGLPSGGEYSIHITDINQKARLESDGIVWFYSFNPDSGENTDISMMMCDLNGDRTVNAKDYAMMIKTNYRFIQFFDEFLNYEY